MGTNTNSTNQPQHFDLWTYDQSLEEDGRDHLGYKLDGAPGFDRRIPDYAMTYDQWCASLRPKWWQLWAYFRRPNFSYRSYRCYLVAAEAAYQLKVKMEARAARERRRILQEVLDGPSPKATEKPKSKDT